MTILIFCSSARTGSKPIIKKITAKSIANRLIKAFFIMHHPLIIIMDTLCPYACLATKTQYYYIR